MSATIDDLSDDLLQDIFVFIAMDISVVIRRRTRSIIACNTVCKHWRAIALGFGKIWAHLIDWAQGNLSWTTELLSRSAPYPLEVGDWDKPEPFPFVTEQRKAVLRALMNHASRLRVFKLYSMPSDAAQIVRQQLLERQMPNLKALFLGLTLLYAIPLLKQNAPNLQSLTVSQTSYFREKAICALDHFEITSLVELNITGCHASIDSWTRLCSGLPNLRWLSLKDSLLPTESILHLAGGKVASRLEMLTVDEMDVKLAVDFAINLSLPPSCGLHLGFSRRRWDSQDIVADNETLSILIQSRIEGWPRGTPRRFLKIEDKSNRKSGYIAIANLPDMSTISSLASKDYSMSKRLRDKSQYDPDFCLRLPSIDSHLESEGTTLLETLLNHFEATLGSTVELDISYGWKKKDSTSPFAPFNYSFFAQSSNVETLSLNNEALLILLPTFISKPEEINNGETIPLLPRLKHMKILLPYTDDEAEKSNHLQIIHDFLLWRRDRGLPLESVAIWPGTFSIPSIRRKVAFLCELDIRCE